MVRISGDGPLEQGLRFDLGAVTFSCRSLRHCGNAACEGVDRFLREEREHQALEVVGMLTPIGEAGCERTSS